MSNEQRVPIVGILINDFKIDGFVIKVNEKEIHVDSSVILKLVKQGSKFEPDLKIAVNCGEETLYTENGELGELPIIFTIGDRMSLVEKQVTDNGKEKYIMKDESGNVIKLSTQKFWEAVMLNKVDGVRAVINLEKNI